MRILVAEDDRLTSRVLERYLTELGHEVLAAHDGAAALRSFRDNRPELLLTDWEMPGLSGMALMQAVREEHAGDMVYVIFLTSREGRQDLIDALSAGADDFIRKPFDREELAVRVRAGARIVKLQQRLVALSSTDPLSGLLNRRGLAAELEKRDDGEGGPAAFVAVDIDHFKRINDKFGHAAGDLVIAELAERLRAVLRDTDVVSRLGGEEFLALLVETGAEGARVAAERARRSVESRPFEIEDGRSVSITASFGVYWTPAYGAVDAEEGARLADEALYEAKQSGRNRVVFRAGSEVTS